MFFVLLLSHYCVAVAADSSLPSFSLVSQSTFVNDSSAWFAVHAHTTVPPAPVYKPSDNFLLHSYVAVDLLPDSTLNDIVSLQANLEYSQYLMPIGFGFNWLIRMWFYQKKSGLVLTSAAYKVAAGYDVSVFIKFTPTDASNTLYDIDAEISSIQSTETSYLKAQSKFGASRVDVAMEQSNVENCTWFPPSNQLKWKVDIHGRNSSSRRWFVYEQVSPACGLRILPYDAQQQSMTITWNAS